MEVGTKHEELVYWYTSFEDPNCIAVVELVATIMDNTNGIQVSEISLIRSKKCSQGKHNMQRNEVVYLIYVLGRNVAPWLVWFVCVSTEWLISLSRQQYRGRR